MEGIESRMPKNMTKRGVPLIFQEARLGDFKSTPSLDKSLFITGGIGTGKTHLSVALIHHDIVTNRMTSGLFITMVGLLSKIKGTFNNSGGESEYDIVTRYQETAYLTLDDIGVEKVSDWVLNVVYQIIDHRYSNGLRTIFTSNYDLNQLNDRLGERITSRIKGMCEIVTLGGGDRREN